MPSMSQRELTKHVLIGIFITLFIYAMSLYMPIVGFFCSLFIPLPILFYRAALGRTTGAVIPVVSTLVMLAISGRISVDVLFFIELLILGFVLSEFLEMNLPIEKIVLYGCLTVLLSSAFGLILYSNISHNGVLALFSEYVGRNLRLTLAIYENMGVSQESIQLVSNSLDQIQYVLVRIIPALIIGSTFLTAWLNLLIARPIFRAKNLLFPDFGPLNRWEAPDGLVWGVIGCGILILFPSSALKLIGLNGLIIFMIVYFFQGIAIVSYYFEKKQLPRLLKVFLYSLIALQQILLIIVISLGFFDTWLNFRKPKPQKGES